MVFVRAWRFGDSGAATPKTLIPLQTPPNALNPNALNTKP